jgi:hypothetical protein
LPPARRPRRRPAATEDHRDQPPWSHDRLIIVAHGNNDSDGSDRRDDSGPDSSGEDTTGLDDSGLDDSGLDDSAPAAEPRTRPTRAETIRALGMAVACVLWGIALCWYSAARLGSASADHATSGEILVTSCIEHPAAHGGQPVTECSGVYRADGDRAGRAGRAVDQEASLPGDHHVGDIVRVRQTTPRTYEIVGHPPSAGWIVGAVAGVALSGVGAVLLRTELRRRRLPAAPVVPDPATS